MRKRNRHTGQKYKGWWKRAKRRLITFLAFSVTINILLIVKIIDKSKEVSNISVKYEQKNVDKRKVTMRKMYFLDEYPTYSYPSQNMEHRIDRLYKRYTRHLDMRDRYVDFHDEESSFFSSGRKLKKSYAEQFEYATRRIIALKFRIEIIEKNIMEVAEGNEELMAFFYGLEGQLKHKEKLSEMQNFYSRFIPAHTYDNIITKTID